MVVARQTTVHDEVFFFKDLGAINIRWYEGVGQKPISFLHEFTATTMRQDVLTQKDQADFEGNHSREFAEAIAVMNGNGTKRK